MSDDQPSTPIHSGGSSPEVHNHATASTSNNNGSGAGAVANNNVVARRERPSRACTARSAARLHAAAAAEAAVVAAVRKQKPSRKERHPPPPLEEEEEPPPSPPHPFSKVVTSLVGEPPPSQLPRWSIRSMWELASILNFLNVFRPLLNIKVEFSVEEFETALITPNNTLAEIHIPLLKAIPPITRMALGQNTWVTVLCRKLRDWWHWVAEGDLPIVASHGAEVEAYNMLDPGIRVVILKALCDIRVEQEDIRNYIDDSIKHGVPPSAFRKERTGGDSYGISYWYEDDPIIGQRLYREIRKVEVKKGKGKSVQPISNSCYQWETVATNLDEFQDVSEKLSSSKNRTEASLGKKLKIDMLPEIEKVHTRKEKLLKKQHRQALLLDSMMNVDGLGPGRSRRGRKPVSYTFDDYDRSINEAIKITKRKPPSPEPTSRRNGIKHENGRLDDTSKIPQHFSFGAHSPDSPDYDGTDEDHKSDQLDRSNRRRQRPQRYSAREYVEAVSENEADFDSDDDIVGEAVYDEEYLRSRKKRRKVSSSSEGDEEYHVDGENAEEEEEEEEEEGDDSSSASDESDQPRRSKKLPGRTRRGTKLRSFDDLQSGLRRSKRATRNRIDYKKYDFSESEPESTKPEKSNGSEMQTDASASDTAGFSMGSEDSEDNEDNEDILHDEDNLDDGDNLHDGDNLDDGDNLHDEDNLHDGDNLDTEEMKIDQPVVVEQPESIKEEQIQPPTKENSPDQDEFEGGSQKRRFLDLNELAPGSGFDDGPMMKDDTDDF